MTRIPRRMRQRGNQTHGAAPSRAGAACAAGLLALVASAALPVPGGADAGTDAPTAAQQLPEGERNAVERPASGVGCASGPPPSWLLWARSPSTPRGNWWLDWRAGELTFVDVRQPHEYAEDHLPGALNIPERELAARRSELPAPRPS